MMSCRVWRWLMIILDVIKLYPGGVYTAARSAPRARPLRGRPPAGAASGGGALRARPLRGNRPPAEGCRSAANKYRQVPTLNTRQKNWPLPSLAILSLAGGRLR